MIEKNTSIDNFQTMEELKKEHFFKAMSLTNGNKKKTAALLGMSLLTMYKLSNKYANESLTEIKNKGEEE